MFFFIEILKIANIVILTYNLNFKKFDKFMLSIKAEFKIRLLRVTSNSNNLILLSNKEHLRILRTIYPDNKIGYTSLYFSKISNYSILGAVKNERVF